MKLHPSNVREQFLGCADVDSCWDLRVRLHEELASMSDDELTRNPGRIRKTRWIWRQTINEQLQLRIRELS